MRLFSLVFSVLVCWITRIPEGFGSPLPFAEGRQRLLGLFYSPRAHGRPVVHAKEPVEWVVALRNASNFQLRVDFGQVGEEIRLVDPSQPLRFTFDTPGVKKVRISLLDNDDDEVEVFEAKIIVEEASRSCMRFFLFEDSKALQSNSINLTIKVGLEFLRDSGSMAESLFSDVAKTYKSMGEHPRLELVGDPDLNVLQQSDELKENDTFWEFTALTKEWTGTSWLRLESSTAATLNGECGIELSKIPVTVSNILSSQPESKPVQVQSTISSKNATFLSRIYSMPCAPSIAVITKTEQSSDVLLTLNGFQTFHQVDVCPSSTGDCPTLVVQDIALLLPAKMLLVTNLGLIEAGLDGTDSPKVLFSTELGAPIRFLSRPQCLGELGPDALSQRTIGDPRESAFLLDTNGNVVQYFIGDDSNTSSATISIEVFQDLLENGERKLASVLANPSDKGNLLFLFNNVAMQQAVVSTNKPSLWFAFPKSVEISSLCVHESGLAVFAYGQDLWISYDSGMYFEKIIAFGNSHERIASCPLSGPTKGVYFARTSAGRLFVGNVNIPGAIPILHGLLDHQQFGLTSGNDIFWISSNLLRMEVPVQTLVRSYELSGESTRWEISSLRGNRIVLSCVETTSKQACFGPQHEGMLLEPLHAKIVDVDANSRQAFLQFRRVLSASLEFKRQESCALQVKGGIASLFDCNTTLGDMPRFPVGVLSTVRYWSVSFSILNALGDISKSLTEIYIPAGEWLMYDSSQWYLSAPPCNRKIRHSVPELPNPGVRLLDRFDKLLVEASISDLDTERNKAYGREMNHWLLTQDTPLTILQSNSWLMHMSMQSFVETQSQESLRKFSVNVLKTDFTTYQQVFPTESPPFSSQDQKTVLMHVEPEGSQFGESTVLFGAAGNSISCLHKDADFIARLIVNCPKFKSFSHVFSVDARFLELPSNYRPPSHRGKGIPLTVNVYNADPSKPLYMDWYKASRDVAQFKQCAAAAERSQCSCEGIAERGGSSHGAEVSDCIKYVQRTSYNEFFVPKLEIQTSRTERGRSLQSKYSIRDVNGRIDFCSNSTWYDTSKCGRSSLIERLKLNPTRYDAILFMGEGLYHFEVKIQDPISFCELKTYILIFVEEPPLSTRSESIAISVTAVSLMFLGLLGYISTFFYDVKRTAFDENELLG